MQAQRGSGGIAPIQLKLGNRRRWVFSTTLRPLYRRKHLVLIVQEDERAPGPVWTGANWDRPARSESLYRLSYRGRHVCA